MSNEAPFTKREVKFRDTAIHLQEQLDLMSIEHEIMRKALETIAGTAADKLQALQARSALANIGASHQ